MSGKIKNKSWRESYSCRKDKTEFIGVDELTARLNNLSYEMLCGISPRVPRVYKNG